MNVNDIQTAKNAYLYARDVIKGRWVEGEPIIATDPGWAYMYARYIIKARFPEGEKAIANHPEYVYWYARDVIKGRFLEGELIIMFSEYFPDYAKLCGMTYHELQ
jgi:hypothetical protein